MTIVLYVAAIAAANVITAATTPLTAGPFVVVWGTFAVAFTFVLRDLIQLRHGRRVAYQAIGLGLLVALGVSFGLGDTLAVVVASTLALAVGETLDTEVFTRMRGHMPERIAVSGALGGLVDTALFVVVGLSPLWSGIIPWSAVPNAIVGVYLVKLALQLLSGAAWWATRGREPVIAGAA